MVHETEYEIENVRNVYDQIAKHFDATRGYGWGKVKEFIANLAPGSRVLDIGCGNGKYLNTNHTCTFTGCDNSAEMVRICQDKGHHVIQADMMNIPVESSSFDSFLSIATIHHLCTTERRVQAVKEAVRCIQSGGTGLIFVWSFEKGGQKKGKTVATQKSQDALIEWNLQSRYSDDGKAHKCHRYYHMFSDGELQTIIERAGGLKILEYGMDHGNWYVVVEKL